MITSSDAILRKEEYIVMETPLEYVWNVCNSQKRGVEHGNKKHSAFLRGLEGGSMLRTSLPCMLENKSSPLPLF